MSRPEIGHITYGNLGTARYHSAQRRWRFSRPASTGTGLHVIENNPIWPRSQAEFSTVDEQELFHLRQAGRRSKKLNQLYQSYPELIPSSVILNRLEQVSSAVVQLAYSHEPLSANHVAYGTVEYDKWDVTPHMLRTRRLLASVTGVSNHLLRLNLVSEETRYARQGDHDFEFATSRFDRSHSVFWTGDDKTAIMDLQFSTDDGSGSLLAVRRHATIDILRPIVRRTSSRKSTISKAEIGTGEVSRDSSLDPNWILKISLIDLDVINIADFAFHPRTWAECAILSISGEVKVLSIKAPLHKRGEWSAELKTRRIASRLESEGIFDDGWGRITWLDNDGPLLTATRSNVHSNILDGDQIAASTIIFDATSQKSYVMDMKHDIKYGKHVFVLTSTDLLIISQIDSTEELLSHPASPGTNLAVSVPHYRDPDDVSLQISITIKAQVACVLIFSRISTLVTGFKFRLEHGTQDIECISDSFLFDISSKIHQRHPMQHEHVQDHTISSVHLELLELEYNHSNASQGDDLSRNFELLEVLLVDHAHGLNRLIALMGDARAVQDTDVILFPSAEEIDHFASINPKQKPDEFILDSEDDSEVDKVESTTILEQLELHAFDNPHLPLNHFAFLAQEIDQRLGDASEMTQSMGSFESALEDILEARNEIEVGIHTLADFLSSAVPVDRIDVVASKISELLNTMSELAEATGPDIEVHDLPQRLKPANLLSQNMINGLQGQSQDHTVQLIPTYEKLLRLYVHSLPPNVSPTTKVWLEKIVRRVSMLLFLSSHGIQTITSQESLSVGIQGETAKTVDLPQLALPIRSTNAKQQESQYERGSQANDYVPSRARESSVNTTQLSSSQPSQLTMSESEEPGSILAQYLPFQSGTLVPTFVRKRVPEWHIGEHPSDLEWKSLSRSASQDSLRSSQSDRRRRKDKGKSVVKESATNQINRDNNDFATPTNIAEQADIPGYDLDDDLLASQHLDSQFLDSSQPLQLGRPASQTLASASAGIRIEGSLTQKKSLRKKKSTSIRKRPSGFR